MSTGLRPKLGNIDWDFGWTYFLYPGEIPAIPGIDYWEVGTRSDTKLTKSLRAAAGYAYSPNFSNTGAWSQYVASGLGVDLPRNVDAAEYFCVDHRRRRLLLVRQSVRRSSVDLHCRHISTGTPALR